MKYTLSLFFLFLAQLASAQSFRLAGTLRDAKTEEGLPFVNILIKGTGRGTTSDLDGKWQLNGVTEGDTLVFSCIGYTARRIPVRDFQAKFPTGVIAMQVQAFETKEVVVLPGENPAHVILRRTLDRKKQLNWERLSSFQYTTYNRFHITRDKADSLDKKMKEEKGGAIQVSFGGTSSKDTSAAGRRRRDSLNQAETDSFFNAQHFFLTETVIEKKFKYPEKVKERVIAARVSGFNDPTFSLFSNEYSGFNIYKDFIDMSGKKYLSPLNYSAFSKYKFTLEDSFRRGEDTVYIITYRPQHGKLFEGFMGALHINAKGWAVESVIARPARIGAGANTEIRQQFAQMEDGRWFPTGIHSRIVFSQMLGAQADVLVGRGRAYIRDVKINPELSNREFSSTALSFDKNAAKQADTFWARHRTDTLSKQDSTTYKVIDSIGKAEKLDQKLALIKVLANGFIPWGIINIPIDKFLAYNRYEGFRIGTGVETNDKVTRFASVGGYAAYGFKDNAFKYGGDITFKPYGGQHPLRVVGFYTKDVEELGGYNRNLRPQTAQEKLRNLHISEMAQHERMGGYVQFSPMRYMTTRLLFQQAIEQFRMPGYLPDNLRYPHLQVEEASLWLRYAYGEKKTEIPGLTFIQSRSKWPVLHLQLTRSWDKQFALFSDRADVQLDQNIFWGMFGTTSYQLRGVYITPPAAYDMPLLRMYSAPGNDPARQSYLRAQNAFETMPPHSYFAERFGSAFVTHSFGKYLFKWKSLQPTVLLHTGAAWGDYRGGSRGIPSISKGYFESGISLERLLKVQFSSFGVSAFYRYGPYATARWQDNMAVKLSFSSLLLR